MPEEEEDPELRLVEDEPEVIRLGGEKAEPETELIQRGVYQPEKKVPVFKKTNPVTPSSSEDETEEGGEEQAEPVMAYTAPVKNVEDAWQNEEEKKKHRRIPVGWFVLFGAFVLGGILWAALSVVKSGQPEATTKGANSAAEIEWRDPITDEEAGDFYARLEEVLRNYLAATTIEEKLKCVRHPDRVRSLMEDYYARHELKPQDYNQIEHFLSLAVESLPFMALSVSTKDGGKASLLVEDTPDGPRVDWESDVVYQPMSLAEFIEKQPQEAVDFRVYLKPDTHYTHGFADEKKYACYYLTTRDEEEFLFGYVERGSEADKSLSRLTEVGKGRPVAALISLKYLPNGGTERSVLIETFHSPRWAYLDDAPKGE